jgi:hypothetical protein
MVSTNTPVTIVNLDDVCESKTNNTLNYLNTHKLQTDDVTMKSHVRISHTQTYTTDEAAAMFRLTCHSQRPVTLPAVKTRWNHQSVRKCCCQLT